MSALTFRLREAPPERLDLSALVPQRLAGLAPQEIVRLPIGTSRMGVVVGDLFGVAGNDPVDIRFEGGSPRFDRLGEGLDRGRITVAGEVGQRLGFAMAAGELSVEGSAGPFAASAATGGVIRIAGNADERAGGAIYGAMHGLNGATLIIGGNAGPRLADRMRRGLVVVTGEAGDFAGSRMIAGTVIAAAVGDHPGYGMRRGTILTRRHGELLPTFVETGGHRFVFLRVLQHWLQHSAPELASGLLATWPDEVRRHAGDLAALGKGEILVAA
ncbi:formylmethanofuran dehydrogenase subunit C [Chelatococcus sp. GCM10030263]|uniref:formylmethanofuran dehydrogenase subunit C n=1 Tax=Chelatococcus sp. GCM10030263 TaxID=3273387 RepID=UPI0036207A45